MIHIVFGFSLFIFMAVLNAMLKCATKSILPRMGVWVVSSLELLHIGLLLTLLYVFFVFVFLFLFLKIHLLL